MKKKIIAISMALCLIFAMSVPVFASSGGGGSTSTQVSYSDISSIFEQITAQFSVSSIIALLAGVLGVSIAFVFMWWAVRKLIKIVMSAIRKGRVSS